jgi:phage terminase small subunit
MPKTKRGPKPKTAANSRPKIGADRPSAAKLTAADFVAPEDLSDVARAEHGRLVALLDRLGKLNEVEPSHVVDLSIARGLVGGLLSELDRDGLILSAVGPRSGESIKANPALSALNSTLQLIRALRSDLQMTPASRPKDEADDAEPIDEADPMAKFLRIEPRSARA